MKVLNKGEVTYGKSYADMINKAIGTNYAGWGKSTVNLEQFGAPGVVAWFVYMDGSEHGYEEGWRWRNYLSNDGNEIREHNVSQSKTAIAARRKENGYFPYRLSFRLDPYETCNKYCCKFVGAYKFSCFLKEDLTAIKYIKTADSFRLGSKGESGGYLSGREEFIKDDRKYLKPVSELGFSESTYRLLKNSGISCAGELLELGLCAVGATTDEIWQKLFTHFGQKEF